MSRGLDKARADLAKAHRDVEKWATALADADAAVRAAEAVDVDDPADLDQVGAQAARAHANAAAARRAHARAAANLAEARRVVLLAEADDEDAAAKTADKVAASHAAKVRLLVSQLRDLDGVTYAPERPDEVDPFVRESPARPIPRGVLLEREAYVHRARAACLRHVAEHGRMPNHGEWQAYGVLAWQEDPATAGMVPGSVGDFLAALAGV